MEKLPPEMQKQAMQMKAAKKASDAAKEPDDEISSNDISEISKMLKDKKGSKGIAKKAAEMAKEPAQEDIDDECSCEDECACTQLAAESTSDDARLTSLQEGILDVLGETSRFGKAVSVDIPGSKNLVYRQRKITERPEIEVERGQRAAARKAKYKRSNVQSEAWAKFNNLCERRKDVSPGRMKLLSSSSDYEGHLLENFPLAYELVEYVNGGGDIGNVNRVLQLKPPVIHDIEDLADSIDWHLLSKGISAEHLETALSKDRNKVVLFMDDRARPRLTQIKEVLNKFGDPRILQKADDISETTGQPHGFYVFEVKPDESLYKPKSSNKVHDQDWEGDARQPEITDSLEGEDEDEYVLFEDVFEPFCSTCGGDLLDEAAGGLGFKLMGQAKKRGQLMKTRQRWSAAGRATARGQQAKDRFKAIRAAGGLKAFKAAKKPQMGKLIKLAASIECPDCGTSGTPLDEHEFSGIYCARHGTRLDKYSKACYECQEDVRNLPTVLCPECKSETVLEATECSVCNIEFTGHIMNDYAGHLADSLFAEKDDDEIIEEEHSWEDPYSVQLADELFSDAEDEKDPFA